MMKKNSKHMAKWFRKLTTTLFSRPDHSQDIHKTVFSIHGCIILAAIIILLSQGSLIVHSQPYPSLFSDINFSNDGELTKSQHDFLIQIKEGENKDPTIIRSRHVKVNLDALTIEAHVRLNLFKDAEFLTTRNTLIDPITDQYIWHGSITGELAGTVTLVREQNSLVGNIRVGTHWYEIRNIDEDFHSIREIDPTAFPDEEQPIPIS